MNKLKFPYWQGAVLGGLTYTGLNLVIELVFPDHWAGSPDRLLGWGYADWSRLLWIPLALQLLGFTGIHRLLRPHTGKWGDSGFWLTTAGYSLAILGLIVEFWIYGLLLVPWIGEFRTGSPGSNLGYAINSYGTFLLIFGLLVYAAACQRSTIPTRWRVIILLIALSMLSIFYFFFSDIMAVHAVVHGLAWIAAGLLLRINHTTQNPPIIRRSDPPA